MFRDSRCKNKTGHKQSFLEMPLLHDYSLSTAIQEGYTDKIETLASQNYDKFLDLMHTKDEQLDKTPIQLVAEQGDLNVLKAILQQGIKISLSLALLNFKQHIRQQKEVALQNRHDEQFNKLHEDEGDLDYRIVYVGLFDNTQAHNLLYKYQDILEDNYRHLKQRNYEQMSRTQSQFFDFFEKHAPEDIKTEYTEASAAAAHCNLT